MISFKKLLSVSFTLSVLYADNSSVFKNVADGILLNNNIDNIEILQAKPLKENETIIEIAFRDKITNAVSIVYAVDDKTLILGKKIANSKVDNSLSEEILLNYKFNDNSEIFLKTLAEKSISINGYDKNKENIYIISNIDNQDLKFLANSNNLEKYNIKLLLTISANAQLEKTLDFYGKDNYTQEEFKNFLFNSKSKNAYTLEDFKNFNNIKKTILDEDFTLDEMFGNRTMYFYQDKRINLTQFSQITDNKDKK